MFQRRLHKDAPGGDVQHKRDRGGDHGNPRILERVKRRRGNPQYRDRAYADAGVQQGLRRHLHVVVGKRAAHKEHRHHGNARRHQRDRRRDCHEKRGVDRSQIDSFQRGGIVQRRDARHLGQYYVTDGNDEYPKHNFGQPVAVIEIRNAPRRQHRRKHGAHENIDLVYRDTEHGGAYHFKYLPYSGMRKIDGDFHSEPGLDQVGNLERRLQHPAENDAPREAVQRLAEKFSKQHGPGNKPDVEQHR